MSTHQRLFDDVNCDGSHSILDAAIVAGYVVELRTEHGACPTAPGAGQINLTTADTNNDGIVNVLDAFRIAECAVNLTNTLCPEQDDNAPRWLRNDDFGQISLAIPEAVFDPNEPEQSRATLLCEAIQPLVMFHPIVSELNRSPLRIEFYAGSGPQTLGAEVLVAFAAGFELLAVMGIDADGASFGYEPYPPPLSGTSSPGVLMPQDYKDARDLAIGVEIGDPDRACALRMP